MLLQRLTVLVTAIVVASVEPAQAHFLWIVPDRAANEKRVHVYFSETAEPDDPALLSHLAGLKLRQVSSDGDVRVLEPTRDKESLAASPIGVGPDLCDSLSYTYGLHGGNADTYLLVYHARMYAGRGKNRWNLPPTEKRLPLELAPSTARGMLTVRVLWNGQAVPAAEVTADPADGNQIKGKTNALGEFSVPAGRPGLYAFRTKHVEPIAGELDGKKYASVRHYSTLVVFVGDNQIPPSVAKNHLVEGARPRAADRVTMRSGAMTSPSSAGKLPDLPFGVTSFGAAIAGQALYVCAGHLGPAHEYSAEGESDRFLRLDLRKPIRWENVGTVPRRAGLAMVSYRGKLYRIGGFEARNKEGDKADLHSTAEFSRFDPATGRWENFTPLPSGRSSHDAVVVGSRLFVVGGWELRGTQPAIWHDTALEIDLSDVRPAWRELPKPPFKRRALALGACKEKVYVLGGMQEQGGSTTTTYMFDPATGEWSPGPKLPGDGLQGFGSSAATCEGRLFATTYAGGIARLSGDGKKWEDAGHLARARFFHRMLCENNSSLIVVGGGNMEEGKDLSLEVFATSLRK